MAGSKGVGRSRGRVVGVVVMDIRGGQIIQILEIT